MFKTDSFRDLTSYAELYCLPDVRNDLNNRTKACFTDVKVSVSQKSNTQ